MNPDVSPFELNFEPLDPVNPHGAELFGSMNTCGCGCGCFCGGGSQAGTADDGSQSDNQVTFIGVSMFGCE